MIAATISYHLPTTTQMRSMSSRPIPSSTYSAAGSTSLDHHHCTDVRPGYYLCRRHWLWSSPAGDIERWQDANSCEPSMSQMARHTSWADNCWIIYGFSEYWLDALCLSPGITPPFSMALSTHGQSFWCTPLSNRALSQLTNSTLPCLS